MAIGQQAPCPGWHVFKSQAVKFASRRISCQAKAYNAAKKPSTTQRRARPTRWKCKQQLPHPRRRGRSRRSREERGLIPTAAPPQARFCPSTGSGHWPLTNPQWRVRSWRVQHSRVQYLHTQGAHLQPTRYRWKGATPPLRFKKSQVSAPHLRLVIHPNTDRMLRLEIRCGLDTLTNERVS